MKINWTTQVLACMALSAILLSRPQVSIADDSLSNYLLTAFSEAENVISPSYSSFSGHNSSWIDEPEARFGFNGQDERSYALRMRPRFSKERSYENSLVQLRRQQEKVFYDIALNEALMRRYKTILAVLRQRVEVEYLEQKSHLALSEVKYLQGISQSDSFSISQLHDTERRYHGIVQNKALHTRKLKALLTQVSSSHSPQNLPEIPQHHQWLMSLDDLSKVMGRFSGIMQPDDIDSNPYIQNDTVNLLIESENISYQRSISSSPIEFVELKYIDRVNEETAVTFGISLPFGKSKGYRNLARQSRVVEAEIVLQRSQREIRDRLSDVKNTISWFLEEARYLKSDIAEVASRMQRTAQLQDPKLMLKLKASALISRHRRSRLHIDALEAYIDYLQLSGKLIEPPIRNVIDASRPVLELVSAN